MQIWGNGGWAAALATTLVLSQTANAGFVSGDWVVNETSAGCAASTAGVATGIDGALHVVGNRQHSPS